MSYASVVLADSPVGYWRLNDAAGSTTVLDASGNANTGTLNGGVALRQRSANGALGTAALFDGSTGYIDIAANASLRPTTAATVELWANPAAGGVGHTQYAVDHDRDIDGISVQINSTAAGFYMSFNGPTGGTDVFTTFAFDGQWHHLVGTYDGANVHVYADGALKTTQAATGSITWDVSKGLRLGDVAVAPDEFYSGDLDEVALYSTGLSATRILAHYNAGLAGLLFGGFGPLGA